MSEYKPRVMVRALINMGAILKRALICRFCEATNIAGKPIWMNLAVTSKCNLLCLTCNVGRKYLHNPSIAQNDLKVHEIEELFLRNYSLLKNIRTVQITGGEPFMRNDLIEIVQVIHKYIPECSIWIATNGTMPKKIANEMAQIVKSHRRISIGISIDGNEKTHDRMRGVKGTYSKANETLRRLVDLRKEIPQLNIALSFTITPINYREIIFVRDLSERHETRLTFRPSNISKIYYDNSDTLGTWNKDKITELGVILNEIGNSFIESLKFFHASPHLYFINGITQFIKYPHLRRNYRCYAGSSSFFLDVKGIVFPCVILDRKMGSIREIPFKSIWNSPKAEMIRKEIREFNCKCWVECETYTNMYEDFSHLAAFFLKEIVTN